MKKLYFDVETTGTNPKVNEIVQIAGLIEIDGKVEEEFNFNIRPTNENINIEALEVIGKTIEELKEYPEPRKVFEQLREILDKYIDKYDKQDKFYPAGHNVRFDLDFLQSFWSNFDKYGSGTYQNWRALDTRVLANILVSENLIDVEDIKLETLCEFYEIEIDAHDALNDIKATRKLYRSMIKTIQCNE